MTANAVKKSDNLIRAEMNSLMAKERMNKMKLKLDAISFNKKLLEESR